MGRRIGEMGGFQYMEFIVPGLIMMAVIQNSYSNVVSSFFSHKFQHSVEELLISPVPNYVILCGFIVGGMARGLAVGTIVTFISDLCGSGNSESVYHYYCRAVNVHCVCACRLYKRVIRE